VTPGEASRFLIQASFGPTVEEIARVRQLGYAAWIDDQLTKPVQRHLPVLLAQPNDGPGRYFNHRRKFVWWHQSVTAADQLRQRIAYAWSQIFVVSDKSTDAFVNYTDALCDYYDTLLINGLGNFRDLLKSVTYHACMGLYLDYIGNEKSPSMPTGGVARRPDENYAREVMQLFTIGLHQLNPDGTPQLRNGQLIPAFNNDDVREMARVFTGITWAGHEHNWRWGPVQMLKPLQVYPEYHDPFRKVLLGGRKTLPSNQYPAKDIDDALDCLFEHPNTPPFICRFLIQRLTTSNPSSAYLGRVAQVFINNGKGVRGDLSAVIRAILLDPGARETGDSPDTGKQREPYLRLVALVRAFNGKANNKDGVFEVAYLDDLIGQEPGSAPSVFNFYPPDYVPPGLIGNAHMVAPEFRIADAVTCISVPNFLRDCIFQGSIGRWGKNILLDFTHETQIAGKPNLLIERLSLLLTGDRMSPETRAIIRNAVEQIPESQAEDRVKLAVYLTSICAESAVQP
jgi:uncharacterized protein (DUF1800 family)